MKKTTKTIEPKIQNAQTKKILVVEDDKDFAWLLRQAFDNHGLLVMYAPSGEEGLVMAQKENPDLIIIDILLPIMTGIDMARRIKEKGLNPQMIFLTNLDNADYISQAMDASAGSDYVVKSDIHLDDFVVRVKRKLWI